MRQHYRPWFDDDPAGRFIRRAAQRTLESRIVHPSSSERSPWFPIDRKAEPDDEVIAYSVKKYDGVAFDNRTQTQAGKAITISVGYAPVWAAYPLIDTSFDYELIIPRTREALKPGMRVLCPLMLGGSRWARVDEVAGITENDLQAEDAEWSGFYYTLKFSERDGWGCSGSLDLRERPKK